jgi:hypothetical protein
MGLPRSARPILEDAKRPAYSAGAIKHLSSKFARANVESAHPLDVGIRPGALAFQTIGRQNAPSFFELRITSLEGLVHCEPTRRFARWPALQRSWTLAERAFGRLARG